MVYKFIRAALILCVPVCLFVFGAYFLIRLRFFFSLKGKLKGALAKKQGGRSGVWSLMLALAGTLGVGNIVGIADAIIHGGAGAVFWMWVSCAFAAAVKYAETALAACKRMSIGTDRHGGALYYIRSGAVKAIFAALCVFCSLTMGSALQSKATAQALELSSSAPPIIIGALMAALTFAVVFGGRRRIFDLCTSLVPIMTLLFVIFSLIAIGTRSSALPRAFEKIISGAFDLKGASFGIGAGALTAIRYGVVRGLLSNEAGCGTSPMAHAASDEDADVQGALGVVEVVVDTAVLCSLTALTVLSSGLDASVYSSGMELVFDAYAVTFPRVGAPFIAVSIFLFAFASIVCWAFYGSECVFFYSKKKTAQKIYSLAVCAAVFAGAVLSSSLLFSLSDICVGAMTIINSAAVFSNRKEIFK